MVTNETIKDNLRKTFELGNTPIIASIITRRLGEVDLKSNEQNINEIKEGIIKWLKAKYPELSEEEILNLIEQKGGFSALVGPYLVTEVKREAEEQQRVQEMEEQQRAIEDDMLIEQNRKVELEEQARHQREMQERDIIFNPELNQKLAKLVSDMKNARSQAQGKFVGIPKDFFREIPDDKLPQVVQYLENELGFEFKSRTHGIVEQEGRTVEEETITKEDLLKGDVKAVIPMKELQTEKFERLLEAKGKDLNQRAAVVNIGRESIGRTTNNEEPNVLIGDDEGR